MMRESRSIPAFIALGANLGNREANLRGALIAVAATPGVEGLRVSTFLENPAVGGPADAPPFLNAAAGFFTSLPASALLNRLLEIERSLGRIRSRRWEPRPIDLDLLLYGNEIIDEPQLRVPHPLLHERRFVLAPLAEIAPDIVHPALGLRIAELLRQLRA